MLKRLGSAAVLAQSIALVLSGCATSAHLLQPDLPPLGGATPPTLDQDHFVRDRGGGLGEEELRAILQAPVELDQSQRLGVLPVTDAYRPEPDVPVTSVPAELTRSLEDAGVFQAVSEIAADWPSDRGLAGLRELAARYRAGYLLLYRYRFADDCHENAWALLYPTLIGIALAPARTLETAGVVEATLFDVRNGTILFTVYERVRGRSEETALGEDRKLRRMKTRLIEQAAGNLAEQVVSKLHRLAAATAAHRNASADIRAAPSS